jgi:pimeloyl-ACP methyl ester carboxylesterase
VAVPLSPSRRVVAYDNRGSGASSVTPGPYTTVQLAGDAAALLDHLDIERADVFGMSMGGIAAVLGHDSAARLQEIAAPTLVLTGYDDRVIPAASSELLRERIPGARLEVIPGAGHLFFIEKPTETLALLEDFLA